MYAVIETGGKQYKIIVGKTINIEKITADIGDIITINQILAICDGNSMQYGKPWINGASVKAKIITHSKHSKVKIFKLNRRKHYAKHYGHRQYYTQLYIESINT